jgi:hypothetical protein
MGGARHYLGAMNKLLPFLFLLAGLSGCGSKGSDPAPTPADPFLGHWQAESLRSVTYDASGKQLTDQTTTISSQLDVTATTLTFTSVVNGKTSTEVDPYTRNGEALTVTVKIPNGETYYARNLTASNFNFEFNGPRVSGKSYYIQTVPYRR